MLVTLLAGWAASGFVVWWQLQRYRDARRCRPLTYIAAFLGFLFPVALIFCLPMDIATARYQLCRLGPSPEHCEPSAVVLSPRARDWLRWTWEAAFWTTAAGTWVLLPLLQGYVESGHFRPYERFLDSLKFNLLLMGGGGIAVGLGLGTVALIQKDSVFRSFASAKAFLMAFINTMGLLFVVSFLGYGLIEVPRALWRSADRARKLEKLLFQAPAKREKELETGYRLENIVTVPEIQALRASLDEDSDLFPYVEELASKAPAMGDERALAVHAPADLTMDKLVSLHYRLQEALARRDQAHSTWEALVEQARSLMAIEESASDDLGLETGATRMRHWYSLRGVPLCLRALAVLSGLLSTIIIWSEVSLALPFGPDLSLIGRILNMKLLSPTMADAVTISSLLYIAVCTYGSFLKLRVLGLYRLLPHRHTDEKSLLFFAAMFCRFIFPLGYNFLTLVEPNSTSPSGRLMLTEFSRVMGDIDLVPLLGRGFALYFFPFCLLSVCLLTLILGKLLSRVVDGTWESSEQSSRANRVSEGRVLVLRASRRRRRSRSPSLESSAASNKCV